MDIVWECFQINVAEEIGANGPQFQLKASNWEFKWVKPKNSEFVPLTSQKGFNLMRKKILEKKKDCKMILQVYPLKQVEILVSILI